jgi:hypothetical protein
MGRLFQELSTMAPQSWSIPRRAAAALGFMAVLAACSGGDGEGTTPSPANPAGPEPAAPSPPPAQPGVLRTITHWAGAPDPGGAGDQDGTGSAARFRQPGNVVVGSDGSLWVAEAGARRIRRIDAQGKVSTVLDGDAAPPVVDVRGHHLPFSFPGAMAAAPQGGVFVVMRQSSVLAGGLEGNGPWAVLHVAPGAPPRLAVLPAPTEAAGPGPAGLALDRQGRLHMAVLCGLWRSDGDVLAGTPPRGLQLLLASDPDKRGPACSFESAAAHGITRLAIDAEDRVLFTLGNGDVQRLEPDLRVTPLGRTVAGNGYSCRSMAADRRGGLLLTSGTSALLRLDASGQEHVVAGSLQDHGWADGPAETARFSTLCGVAVDAQGRTVLADQGNHTVRRMESDGRVTTLAGLADRQPGHRDGQDQAALFGEHAFLGPGVGGEVVIAERWNQTVREVDAQQRVRTRVGVPEPQRHEGIDGPAATARLVHPRQALKTADGSVWIADGSKLRHLGTDGVVRTVATSASFEQPMALALDGAGDVVVIWATSFDTVYEGGRSRWQHRLARYSALAPSAAPVPLDLRASDELNKRIGERPMFGLCPMPDGSLAYTQGNAVLRRSADGTVNLLAGAPEEPGHTDGPAAAARFNFPVGLACDAAGGIYVADYENHTVRYIGAQRMVRTVLGTPGRAAHRIDTLPGELHSPRSLVLVPGGLVVATGLGLVRAGF